MNRLHTRTLAALAALTGLLAAGPAAAAQGMDTSLPITSVGDQLLWTVGDQTLNLTVPSSGRVRLDLYSASFDPADYRRPGSYGDEQYAGAAVTSTFTLLDTQNRVVLRRTFAPGAHSWTTFLDQDLLAGTYRLQVNTLGNGKNTFAVRLTGLDAAVQADQLSVNIHARDWVPAVNVTTDGRAPYVLRLYDGDGPQELEARVRDGQGRVTPLTVSGELTWTDLPLPEAAGTYVVELRQPGQARQYSNTVSFSLLRAGSATPLTLTRVDQTGQLRVNAELILPDQAQPTQVQLTAGSSALTVQGTLTQRLPAGTYPLSAAEIPGAALAVTPATATVTPGRATDVTVQVRPQVALRVETDKRDVCVGDTVTLTARATTDFAGTLPAQLTLDTPGLTGTPGAAPTTVRAGAPATLTFTGTATTPGPLTLTARLNPWGQTQQVTVLVRSDVTGLQLTRAPLSAAAVGTEVNVTLTVTNTTGAAVPFVLTDEPGEGLQALDATRFEGTLAPGEQRTLVYRARVLRAGETALQAALHSPSCAATQTAGATVTGFIPPAAQVAEPTPVPTPPPAPLTITRSSTVTVPFRAPTRSGALVIAQRPPDGAAVVSGSSRLNGQALPDPQRGPSGTLYWALPAARGEQAGQLSYDLRHTAPLGALPAPALLLLGDDGRQDTMQGDVDAADLRAAAPLQATEAPSENEGALKLPVAGAVLRDRDRISVVVEAPTGPVPPLLVNGVAVSSTSVGSTVTDEARGVQRLTFVGVPLQAGPNTLSFLDSRVTVHLVGATRTIQVIPTQLQADGSTPLRLTVRALDAFGVQTSLSSVTLRTNLEVRTPDAEPGESGYQLRLTGGEGVLELQPQASPATLTVNVLVGDAAERHTFDVRPDAARVGVGVLSATLGLDGQLNLAEDLTWQARAAYEGPIAGGKLYVAADKDGLPTDQNTLIRNPVLGDASTRTVTLQGSDPVAAVYDHPDFRVQYRQTQLPMDVLPVAEQFTALSAYSKGNPGVAAFVAAVPRDRVNDVTLTPDGTRLLRLPDADLAEGSDTLVQRTTERGTGKVLRDVTLVRNVDYVLDPRTGIITLARAVEPFDAQLNPVTVVASYRLRNAENGRRLAYGAQVRFGMDDASVGVAAVQIDGTTTYGVHATYEVGPLRAETRLAAAGGLQGSADLSAQLGRGALSARVRYQDATYAGLNPFSVGLTAAATYRARLGDTLSAVTDAEYHDTPTAQGGSVGARVDTRAGAFSVGAGARYTFGDTSGLAAVVSGGYHQDPADVDVVHTQPLTGALDPTTDVTAKIKVTDKVTLGLRDVIVWGAGNSGDVTHAATLSLDSRLGNVNYAAAYELPTAAGEGNRARFGVSTALPLSEQLTLGLRGSATSDLTRHDTQVSAGADLSFRREGLRATGGTDLTATDQGFGVVLRGGVTGTLTPELTVTGDALAELGRRQGVRASLGYAYRTGTLNSLGYARYVQGSLAGEHPEFSAGLSAELHRSTWALRAGLDTRTLLNDPGSFTAQLGLGATAYVTERFGLGVWGRALTQPGSGSAQYGYGLEASIRALPGTWLTAGYNLRGFDGLPSATYTKPGAYLRLDVTLDDTVGDRK